MRTPLAVLGLGLLLMAGCGGTDEVKSGSSAKPPKNEVNMMIDDVKTEESSRNEAIKACVSSEEEKGVPSSVAAAYCDCAINKMIDELGSEGLTRFGMSMLGAEDITESEAQAIEDIALECSLITLVDLE
jgi:hypothetical protein